MVQRHVQRNVAAHIRRPVIALFLTLAWGGVQAAFSGETLQRIEISSGWKIRFLEPCEALSEVFLAEAAQTQKTADWLDVGTMPATVHDILLRQGKIEAPWLARGTEKCFWVGQKDWVYAVRFALKDQGPEAWLRFQGIENKVDVYLNGKRLASHANKLPLAVNVSNRLESENVLVLHCHANANPGQGERSKRGSYLGPNPAISSVGVFDKVFLEISEGHLLHEVVTDVSLNETLTQGTVVVDAVGNSPLSSVALRVHLKDSTDRLVAESTVPVTVKAHAFKGRCTVQVDRPDLWWPRGYGDQPLYHVEISLLSQGQVQQTERRTLGFRRITMPDPLHFVVNNVPVFLRGGNWVTPNLMSDVWDKACADRLFDLAENAHFNAFRVWGPAPTAPPDAFYEQANARGFLVWQDFPRLPMRADSQSIATCQGKARATIKRLKHHPSILCWCGINEAAQWAHEDYNKDFTDHGPWSGLAAAEAVGAVCQALDPDRYYQHSSPYYGMNPNDPREGNTHGYTNMWYVPGYDYLNFASEDTRISAPVLHKRLDSQGR